MKNLKNVFVIALTTISFTTMSCTNATTKTAESTEEHNHTTSAATVNPTFADQKVNAVYQHYIHLKTALVNENNDEAKNGATMLEKALTDAGKKEIAAKASKIKSAGDIEQKRAELNSLSNDLASFFKASKLTSGSVYKQYCPMANNGEGGSWLASEKEIKNPYYGSSMLKCGSVEEEIK